jgi:hypothetical protein
MSLFLNQTQTRTPEACSLSPNPTSFSWLFCPLFFVNYSATEIKRKRNEIQKYTREVTAQTKFGNTTLSNSTTAHSKI